MQRDSDRAGGGHTAHGARAPDPQNDGLCFLGPLHELVAVGLYRPALDALCSGASDPGDPPIDRAYLLKILDEEVGRQFGHPLRPVLELVLNAIDASRPAASAAGAAAGPTVDVAVGDGWVEVADAGDGMGLRAILSRLLVPFATDKRPGLDLGRFGVGFFSVLGLGLAQPERFGLSLATGDGRDGWSIRVIAAGDRAATLMCSVRRTGPARGTRVRVASPLLDADAVRSYLRDALHFFPPARALVRVDGAAVNDGSLIVGGKLFEDDAARPGAAPLVGRFQLGGRGLSAGISAATFHAGVKVEPCLAIAELALVDFPPEVELTEGRDALKPGPEFDAVATAFYRRLVRLADDAGADRLARDRLAEIAAQISALMLQSAGWEESARDLAAALLGPNRFLVSPERREAVIGFFGPAMVERLFVPESFWAEREWQPFLPGERELLERELLIDPPETLAALARRRPDLAGLAVLVGRSPSPETAMVALCRARAANAWSGPLPCLGTRRLVLVREDSQAMQQPSRWCDWYALRAAFDRASGVREPEFERDLIVSESVMSGGES